MSLPYPVHILEMATLGKIRLQMEVGWSSSSKERCKVLREKCRESEGLLGTMVGPSLRGVKTNRQSLASKGFLGTLSRR